MTTAIPTTERFYKYLMRVYQIIEKNRDWYEDLLNNKISDQQFTVSTFLKNLTTLIKLQNIFNLCTKNKDFMSAKDFRNCFGLDQELALLRVLCLTTSY